MVGAACLTAVCDGVFMAGDVKSGWAMLHLQRFVAECVIEWVGLGSCIGAAGWDDVVVPGVCTLGGCCGHCGTWEGSIILGSG